MPRCLGLEFPLPLRLRRLLLRLCLRLRFCPRIGIGFPLPRCLGLEFPLPPCLRLLLLHLDPCFRPRIGFSPGLLRVRCQRVDEPLGVHRLQVDVAFEVVYF